MNNSQNSFYDSIHDYVKGQTLAAWVFWLSVVLLAIGINNFVEDTYSSYIGVQEIEKTFNVKAVSWDFTYLGMSLAFQIITVLAGIAYMSDRKKYWYAGWLAIAAQGVDFIADVWYRANGTWNGWGSVTVSLALTFIFFTIGSELAVTVGLGLVARLFVEGMAQTGILVRNIIAGFVKLAQILASGSADGKGATHSNITNSFHDNKHQGSTPNPWQQNKGNGGNGNGGQQNQPKNNMTDPNRKPDFRPADAKPEGKPAPKVETIDITGGEVDQETLKRLFGVGGGGGGRNSDGSPKSDNRNRNPFQGNGGPKP